MTARLGMRRRLIIASAIVLGSCAAQIAMLPPPPLHPNGQALWRIVHDQCLPDQQEHHDPAPCAEVRPDRGYAVLKDIQGASQYLILPTTRVTGLEDPQLRAADAPDYFAIAWDARRLVAQRLASPLPREDVSVAINSIYGRSQDLLHFHVDCLRADVRDNLKRAGSMIGDSWSTPKLQFGGGRYRAIRVAGDETPARNPITVLADGLGIPAVEMGAWTLVMVGSRDAAGQPDFILLAARADPAAGFNASGEQLQDHACQQVQRPVG